MNEYKSITFVAEQDITALGTSFDFSEFFDIEDVKGFGVVSSTFSVLLIRTTGVVENFSDNARVEISQLLDDQYYPSVVNSSGIFTIEQKKSVSLISHNSDSYCPLPKMVQKQRISFQASGEANLVIGDQLRVIISLKILQANNI